MAGRKFSEYYEQLDKYTKERYEEKLNYIGPEVVSRSQTLYLTLALGRSGIRPIPVLLHFSPGM